MKSEVATFGAGCFWNVETDFRRLPGVIDTTVGFMGGDVENPSYELVCGGNTGHAEVTQVIYDPRRTTYDELLEKFWEMHDPTQVNRQGPDVGEQYRSAIFYHSPEQKRLAEESKKKLEESGKYKSPIATLIEPAGEFYKAEEYHQRYLEKQGQAGRH